MKSTSWWGGVPWCGVGHEIHIMLGWDGMGHEIYQTSYLSFFETQAELANLQNFLAKFAKFSQN